MDQANSRPKYIEKADKLGPPSLVALSILLTSIFHIPLSVYPIARDQGVWLCAAKSMTAGKTFFLDFLHFNLPGSAFGFRAALAITGDPKHASALLACVTTILLILGIYLLLGAAFSRWAGAFGAFILACTWHLNYGWWRISQKDFLATPWLLLCTWAAVKATEGGKNARWYIMASGLLTAIGSQFKPIYILPGFAIVGGLWLNHWLKEKPAGGSLIKSFAGIGALFTLGGFIGYLPLIAHLAIGGGLDDAFNAVSVIGSSYVSHSKLTFYGVVKRWARGHPKHWYLLYLGYSGILLLLISRRYPKRWWILVPGLMAFSSYFIQGKGTGYHRDPWTLMLYAFAGITVWWIFKYENYKPFKWRTVLYAALAIYMTFHFSQVVHRMLTVSKYANREVKVWTGELDRKKYHKRFFKHDGDHPNPHISEKLARWLNKRTRPDETIQVWGHECQIYVLADRMYATQAPFDQMLTAVDAKGDGKKWMERQHQRFIELLEKNKPKYFVITTRDRNPVEKLPSDKSLKLVKGLPEYLDQHYKKERKMERFIILKRKEEGKSEIDLGPEKSDVVAEGAELSVKLAEDKKGTEL